MPPERILITGATGFDGKWLARELSAALPDAQLCGVSHRDADAGLLTDLPPGIIVRTADLTDPDQTAEVIGEAKPDAVFHLAGFASAAGGDREEIFRVNVGATETLLRLLTTTERLCRVLVASSGYIYGATETGRPAREPDMPRPVGDYAESKVEMERVVRPFADIGNVALTVARAFNHTGPGQKPHFAIPAFARQIARIERGLEPPIVPHGNLSAIRDFLDVRDVARAYVKLVLEAEPVSYRVVNVCSGVPIVLADALKALLSLSAVPITPTEDPARMRPLDLPESVGDPTSLQELTGWNPEIPFETTLAETLDWWRKGGD